MVKKIKSSLSAKSFLFIALLLVLCGLLIYSSVVLFLPNSYTIVASDRINQELRDLAATLSETNFTQADDVLATFCRDNRASVLLTGWGERLLIGYVDKGLDSGDVFTTTLNVTFADRPVSYTLTVSAPISAGHELTMAFGELLPVLLVIVLFISALTGQRTERIFELVNYVNEQSATRITTGMLNDVLADAQMRQQPPTDKGRRLKIYYMTQTGVRPPNFVIFCNSRELFHFSYQRYIENQIRAAFGLEGTPVRIVIRQKGDKE